MSNIGVEKMKSSSSTSKGLRTKKDTDGIKKPKVFKDYRFKEGDALNLVGKKVRIYWPLDAAWYEGVVKQYDPRVKKHVVDYDDGDREVLNFHKEKIRILLDGEEKRKEGKRRQDEEHERNSKGGNYSEEEEKDKDVDDIDEKKSKRAKKMPVKNEGEKNNDEGGKNKSTEKMLAKNEVEEIKNQGLEKEDNGDVEGNPERVQKGKQLNKRGSKKEASDFKGSREGIKRNKEVPKDTVGSEVEMESKIDDNNVNEKSEATADVSGEGNKEEAKDQKNIKKRFKRGGNVRQSVQEEVMENQAQGSERAEQRTDDMEIAEDTASVGDEGGDKVGRVKEVRKLSKRKADGNAISGGIEGKQLKQAKDVYKADDAVVSTACSEQTSDDQGKHQGKSTDVHAQGANVDEVKEESDAGKVDAKSKEKQIESKGSPLRSRKNKGKKQTESEGHGEDADSGVQAKKNEGRDTDATDVDSKAAEKKSSERNESSPAMKAIIKKQGHSRKTRIYLFFSSRNDSVGFIRTHGIWSFCGSIDLLVHNWQAYWRTS